MDNFSEPSDSIIDAMNSLRGWKQRAEAAESRVAELEQRLATPVRLPVLCDDGENDNEYTEGFREGFSEGVSESANAIRAAGFTVGDE